MKVLSTTENQAKPKIVDILQNNRRYHDYRKTKQLEGKIEGKEEATIAFVEKLVKIGMDAAAIAQTFELPQTKVEEIIAKMQPPFL